VRMSRLLLVLGTTAVVTAVCLLCGARNAGAPTVSPFSDIGAGLTGVYFSSAAWGDYDSDGDLDALVAGNSGGYGSPSLTLYRNDGSGVFTPAAAGLPGIFEGSVAWGDYDRDGDLDLLLAGDTSTSPPTTAPISRIYRNDGGSFNEDTTADAALVGVTDSSVAWGDYDSDGDLDVLLTGLGNSGYTSEIYRNDGGVFSPISAGLTTVGYGRSAWGDYDKDGDLDILLTGYTGGSEVAEIFANSGGVFGKDTTASASLTGVSQDAAAWGDYDSDGDLDILLAGYTGSGYLSDVYKNDGSGGFSGIGASLAAFDYGDAAWGDYDSDGYLDIALTGALHPSGSISGVYRNLGSDSFAAVGAGLTPANDSSVAWGDYDADGRLDLLLTGYDGSNGMARIYGNSYPTANTRPSAPGGLKATSAGDKATLSWNAASDGQTPAAGLSYNLRVGTTPGGSDVVSPMASSGGFRRLPAIGNAGEHTSFTLANLPNGTYYWSVQAIDNSFAGSAFASEQSFTVPPTFVFSSAAYSVGEAGPSVEVAVKRAGATAGTDSVHVASVGGSATAGSDYTGLPQDVSFSNGETEKTVTVLIADDSAVEGSETVLLALSNPSPGTVLGSPSTATLTITDNDVAKPAAKPSGKIASCKLSKKKFKASLAKKVKLTCTFKPKSKVFRWVLSIKKGKKWALVKSVRKTSFYKVRYTTTVKKLFAGKPVKRGAYRLRLSADRNSRTLGFRVT
jgi:hypothetical protein